MSNPQTQDVKDGGSSLGKNARQRRMAGVRDKKTKRFKENSGLYIF